MMTAVFAWAAGMGAGILLVWWYLQRKAAEQQNRLQAAEIAREVLQQQLSDVQTQRQQMEQKLVEYENRALELTGLLGESRSKNEQLNRQLSEQEQQLQATFDKMNLQFKDIANSILEDKSKRFTEHNKVQLEQLLNPLREKLRDFEQKVQTTHQESLEKQAGLFHELKNLRELNLQMSEEAKNLTRALKGDNKTQGNWGEVVLQRILERSGLTINQEYKLQDSAVNEEGRRLQPDVTILLPEQKYLVVDSKVSLVDYERYVNADDETERTLSVKRHLQSIRNHVRELSAKNYHALYGEGSPDFVLLFVPIEPAFMLAVQEDADLFQDAFDRNIVIVSTSTLLATLRTIASIWRQENQNKNAQEIARQAGSLYDKFIAFSDDMSKVGIQIEQMEKVYAQAMNKLKDGKDNLIRKTQRLRELGAKSTKQIDQRLLDEAEEE
jgi:DNA recombination protein RmuC